MSIRLRMAAAALRQGQPQMAATRIGDLCDYLATQGKGLILITPGTLAEPGAAVVVALDPGAARDLAEFVRSKSGGTTL